MRITPGQRLAGFTAAAAVCVLVYLVLFSMLSHGAESQISTFAFIAPLLLSVALFGLNHIFLRAEGQQMSAIGFDHASHRVTQSALGFGGGVMLILLWALIMAACMGMRWHRANLFHASSALSLLLFTLFLGASEELAYRAYAMVRIGRSIGPLGAILVTSFVFTVLHVQGGVPWLSAIAGVSTCAILYAVLFERTRSLPLVLGFHVANNVAQNLFGLRGSPLSLIEPVVSHSSGGGLTLALVGACNLAIASLLWHILPAKSGSDSS
jgi:membrane protease YdiL (CAAX protease family)